MRRARTLGVTDRMGSTSSGPADRQAAVVDNHSSPEAKITLFRSLFRGRDDVYPRRFESRRTGKSGYSPACANEWTPGLCDKRAIKCAECPNRSFLPVTDDALRWHLSGRDSSGRDFVMGVYRRLETLPQTAGLFRLNAEVSIPFDRWGKMEVDLLCANSRLAVEIDGDQHLADPEAYRRDRRKDALLQENGYFVLRFLAQDVGKRLDDVLDAILRTLAHRQRSWT